MDLEFLPARGTQGILTHLLVDKKNGGFTLIEVMIVVAIIAIFGFSIGEIKVRWG